MVLHSPTVGKRLWNHIRVAFFMMRKGLAAKRKLIVDLNLMVKKGKLVGKSLGKRLALHHHAHFSRNAAPPRGFGFGLPEYEFSCSNSPIRVPPHVGGTSKRPHNYFPCISTTVDDAEESAAATPMMEYSPQFSYLSYDLAPGEKLSPLPSPAPFSVRISNYSSDDEEGEDVPGPQVDDDAEDFIRRFHDQLRAQSRIGFLKYQVEY